MANTCFTQYHFEGNERDMKMFEELLNRFEGEKEHNNYKYDLWYFINFAYENGYVRHNGDWYSENGGCRGGLEYIEIDENYIQIDCEDAWGPHPRFWFDLIKDNEWKIRIAFEAEEPGCDVYEVYDPHDMTYCERYKLDSPTFECGYYELFDELLCDVNTNLPIYLREFDVNNVFEKTLQIRNEKELLDFIEENNNEYPDSCIEYVEFADISDKIQEVYGFEDENWNLKWE